MLFALFLSTFAAALSFGSYPLHPDQIVTPGSLCTKPDEFRYRERIAYCDRDVSSSLKRDIIAVYEDLYEFSISPQQRSKYKIDHYIPLCMGGSNERDNLWPQQEKVYQITDPLEQILCEKLKAGKIRQTAAIDMIRQGKNHLEQVPELLAQVQKL